MSLPLSCLLKKNSDKRRARGLGIFQAWRLRIGGRHSMMEILGGNLFMIELLDLTVTLQVWTTWTKLLYSPLCPIAGNRLKCSRLLPLFRKVHTLWWKENTQPITVTNGGRIQFNWWPCSISTTTHDCRTNYGGNRSDAPWWDFTLVKPLNTTCYICHIT